MLVTVERLLSVLDANNSPSFKGKIRPVPVVASVAVTVLMKCHFAAHFTAREPLRVYAGTVLDGR